MKQRKRILIGMECSGVIRRSFQALGHEAYSCDLKPARDGEVHYHLQCDIADALKAHWDLIIIHPECTALTVAGNGTYAKGKPKHAERLAAIQFTHGLWEKCKEKAPRVCLENPMGVLSTSGLFDVKPQYIQPHDFGEDASKVTGLWLHNLPPLESRYEDRFPGRVVEWPKNSGKLVERWGNQTDSGQNILGPSDDRPELRSNTYPKVAAAMAWQWGNIDLIEGRPCLQN